MREIEAPEIFGYTIFCDDIRFEHDGKVTLVGIYQGAMMVRAPEFPITLPKFALSIVFSQKKTDFEPKLLVKVFVPGDKEDEASFIFDIEPPSDFATFKSDRPNIQARANVVLSPFVINAPGLIKVRVERRGELYPVGRFEIMAEVTSPTTSPPPS